ncbi:MAG: class I SAM-dependent methyltransferase [Candidatus Binatia bacterium]
MTSVPCAICGNGTYRLVVDMGWRRILRCSDCGLVRADPLPTFDEKLASETNDYEVDAACPEVQDLFNNYHRDYVVDPIILRMQQHLGDLEKTLGGPGSLLDIGAATGIFMHLARERGWTPLGIELCEERAAAAAKEFDLSIHTGMFTADSLDGRRFDAATMLDVVEHTTDPLAMLESAHAVLRPGGAVFVAVPNQNCLLTVLVNLYARLGGPSAQKLLPRLYVPIHLHYFTPRTLTRLVTDAGFRVVHLEHAPVYLGRYEMSLLMKLPLKAILAVGAALKMNARIEIEAVRA